MEKNLRLKLNIALTAFLFLASFISVGVIFFSGGSGNMQVVGTRAFMYFTVDSNLLCGLACLISCVYSILLLCGKIRRLPGWVSLLKFCGTSAALLTFTVVMCFLGLIYGYGAMFAGVNLYLHGVVPVLAACSFVLLDPWADIRGFRTLFGILPVIVYGIFYIYLVVILGPEKGGWYDFYSFNSGPLQGKWYLSVIVVIAVSYLLGLLILVLQRRSIGGSRRRVSDGRND